MLVLNYYLYKFYVHMIMYYISDIVTMSSKATEQQSRIRILLILFNLLIEESYDFYIEVYVNRKQIFAIRDEYSNTGPVAHCHNFVS